MAGTLSLIHAEIEMGFSAVSAAVPLFATGGKLAIAGSIKTKAATNANFADLSAFNGSAHVDTYAALASAPTAGAYTIHSKTDATAYHGGQNAFPSAPFTFIPTVTFATPGDLAVAYATQSGWGYKIGKMVFFNIALTFTPTHTTAAGEFRVGGLPNGSATGAVQETGIQIVNINTAWTWPVSATSVNARLSSSSTQLRVYGHGSGIVSTAFTAANVPTGTAKSLVLSGSYLTA